MTLVQLALADSSMDNIKYGLRAIVNLAARNDANQAELEALGVYKGLFVILDCVSLFCLNMSPPTHIILLL